MQTKISVGTRRTWKAKRIQTIVDRDYDQIFGIGEMLTICKR